MTAAAVANPTASEKKENAASLVKAESTPEPKEGAASEMRGIDPTPITSPLQQAASSTQAMSPRCQASAPPSPAIAPSEEAEQSEKVSTHFFFLWPGLQHTLDCLCQGKWQASYFAGKFLVLESEAMLFKL